MFKKFVAAWLSFAVLAVAMKVFFDYREQTRRTALYQQSKVNANGLFLAVKEYQLAHHSFPIDLADVNEFFAPTSEGGYTSRPFDELLNSYVLRAPQDWDDVILIPKNCIPKNGVPLSDGAYGARATDVWWFSGRQIEMFIEKEKQAKAAAAGVPL